MPEDSLKWILAAVLAIFGGATINPDAFSRGKESSETKHWTVDYVLSHAVSKQELGWKLEVLDSKITGIEGKISECNENIMKLQDQIRSMKDDHIRGYIKPGGEAHGA